MPSGKPPAHSADVDAWFADLTHPLDEVMQLVRDTILLADPRVAECIKWKSPTFVYEGNIASINPRARRFVQLMFHRGADIPGDFPRLVGGSGTAKYMTFGSANEVQEQAGELQSVVRAWCEMKDARGT